MEDSYHPLAITPDEATEFYRALGRALWSLGAFEYYVVYYIVIVLQGSFDSMEAAERELDRAFSFTLGNLLREFRKYRDLSPEFDRRLDAFKAERDWLCHRIYRENHRDLLIRTRFDALVQRLRAFKAEATALSEVLDHSFDNWLVSRGVTKEEMDERIRHTLDEWKES
jgi:hypothetical protein